MDYVIGIDIGTTHCKAVAITPGGDLLFQDQTSYPTIQHADGQSEQDAELIFRKVLELLYATVNKLRNQNQLKGIGFSAAMHSILPVDKAGIPLTNVFTWADTRSSTHCKELIESGAQDQLYPFTGVPLHPMLPLCKMLWIRQAMPTIFSLAKKFISIKEFVFFKLFGRYIVDYSIASATGLFNIHTLTWDENALHLAKINAGMLSLPVPIDHCEFGMKEEYQRFLNIPTPIPFVVGSSDGALANIGSGAINDGEAAITIGTSGAVRVVSKKANPDKHHRLFNYVVEKDLFVCGGPVNNGGIVVKWFAENFLGRSFERASDFTWFMEDASKIEAGANGLLFFPYLLGERAPYWDANLRAGFVGLDIKHRKEHMMRAVVEGVCFGLYSVLLAIESAYGKIETLYASGGFTQSGVWLQMIADIFNKRIVVAGQADASALGASVVALYATHLLDNIRHAKELVAVHSSYYPNQEVQPVYQQHFQVFQSIVPKIKDEFPKLKGISI